MKHDQSWHWFEYLIIAASLLCVVTGFLYLCKAQCHSHKTEVGTLTVEDRATRPAVPTEYFAPKDQAAPELTMEKTYD